LLQEKKMSLSQNSQGIFANVGSSKSVKIEKNTCFQIDRDINGQRVTTIYKILEVHVRQNLLHVETWREKNGEKAAHWSDKVRNFRFSNPVKEFYLSTMKIVACPIPSPSRKRSRSPSPPPTKKRSPSPSKKIKRSPSPSRTRNCDFSYQENPEDNVIKLLSDDAIINGLSASYEDLKYFKFNFPPLEESGLKAVKTGHGFQNDCLIHAILNCCDKNFRHRNSTQKDIIASHVRRKILSQLLIKESVNFSRKQYKKSLTSKNFLEDVELGKIAECLKLCFLVFSVGDGKTSVKEMKIEIIGANDVNNPPKRCFMIQNNGTRTRSGNHYSSVCDPTDEDFSASFDNATEIVDEFYKVFPYFPM